MREVETAETVRGNPWWDPERQLVYSAENEHRKLFGDHVFTDLAEARRWSRQLQREDWWPSNLPHFGLRRERENPIAAFACKRGDRYYVSYPDREFYVNRSVIIHEMAHLVNKAVGSDDCHGPVYRRAHVDLVRLVMSNYAGQRMLELYHDRNLRVARSVS